DKEILKFLNDAGFSDVTLRDIKDITAGRVGKKRTTKCPKKNTVVYVVYNKKYLANKKRT
ncbi:hypothetical protein ACVGXS_12565, partial [Enterobacter hormaechei]